MTPGLLNEDKNFRDLSILNLQFFALSSGMILKIRQYLLANTFVRAAKVFAQSVDITPSGFDRQL